MCNRGRRTKPSIRLEIITCFQCEVLTTEGIVEMIGTGGVISHGLRDLVTRDIVSVISASTLYVIVVNLSIRCFQPFSLAMFCHDRRR